MDNQERLTKLITDLASNTEESKGKNIWEKLTQSRFDLTEIKMPKTGKMSVKGSSYKYFQLSDIQPFINVICQKNRLAMKLNLLEDKSELTIINIDKVEETAEFSMEHSYLKEIFNRGVEGKMPMIQTKLQDLGSKNTYVTRYLLIQAFNLSEDDLVEILASQNKVINQNNQINIKQQKELQNNEYRKEVFVMLQKKGVEDLRSYLETNYPEEYKIKDFKAIAEALNASE